MPITILKKCYWCSCDMATTRSSKKLCSQRCHQAFHRWRQKFYPAEGPAFGFKLIEEWVSESMHPNPNHSINKIVEP